MASHDYNSGLTDGPSFDSCKDVQGSFDRFLSQCFDLSKDSPTELGVQAPTLLASSSKSPLPDLKGKAKEGETGKAAQAKPKGLRGHDTMVKKVLNADGEIWIPDVTGLPRPKLQDMVRGFLTAHYREYPQGLERPSLQLY